MGYIREKPLVEVAWHVSFQFISAYGYWLWFASGKGTGLGCMLSSQKEYKTKLAARHAWSCFAKRNDFNNWSI